MAEISPITLQRIVDMLTPIITKNVIAELESGHIRFTRNAPVLAPIEVSGPQRSVERKIPVSVVGMLPQQAQSLLGTSGSVFDLRFITAAQAARLKRANADYCVLMINFISHAACEGVERNFPPSSIVRVTGGVSSIRKALHDLKARHNLTTH